MKFQKLNEMIPYVTRGKQKILSMQPYNGITLRLPGRHAKDTDPEGGDFVVCVDDENKDWVAHQFTHNDLFNDLADKAKVDQTATEVLMSNYLRIVREGKDPEKIDHLEIDAGIHVVTFGYAVQCLAVAEHRRYARFEKQFGGRYLPFRFAAGIVEGNWNATLASERQRRGRPGVEWLERQFGTPKLTEVLLSAN